MRNSHIFISGAAAVLGLAAPAAAQEYAPLAPLSVVEKLADAAALASLTTEAAELSAATSVAETLPLRCTTPPAANALGTAQFTQTTTDFEGAVAAGLPVGSMSASTARKILVQDWMRTAHCVASDGKTELVYGQGIRLFASSDNLEVEGDVTLGMLAANSTLHNRNSKVLVTIIGFNDAQLTTLASGIFGPINVDRFATVDGLAKKMVDRAATLTNGTVQRIGIVFPPSSAHQHVLSAFAVQQVANGASCDATKAKFPAISPSDAAQIASVYQELDAACGSEPPGRVSRARAAEALGSIRVRK